jgi:hypothetical protein
VKKRNFFFGSTLVGMVILVGCFSNRAAIIRTSFNTAWWGYEHHLLPGDFRTMSNMVHTSGSYLIRSGLSLNYVLHACTRYFRGGCLHGAVMEYASALPEISPESIHSLCGSLVDEQTSDDFEYFQCVHGAGHVLMIQNNNLTETLKGCSLYFTAYQDACASGVFMEYSVPHHERHDHSRSSLPCDSLPLMWQRGCYRSEGFYRHYMPNANDFEASYAYCDSLEKTEWCREGVDRAKKELEEY